ncbi:MAG: hypothetical protein L0331_23100, partial [Chloroflexi bacterium]|nr:hypothetical protein [Chloroflexota bacterium]
CRQYDYLDGQWNTTDNPPGVVAALEGPIARVTIPSTLLPEQGAFYVAVASDNKICDNAGATELGAAVSFRKEGDELIFSMLAN